MEKNKMEKKEFKRDNIGQEYKWNLSDIYENYSAWEKDFEKVGELKGELAKFKGQFGNEGKLLEFFQKQEEMDKISYKLYRYPQLARDLNSSDKEAVEHLQKVQFLFAEISTELSWVNSELVDNRENIEKWIEKKEFEIKFRRE